MLSVDDPGGIAAVCERSLQALGVGYFDLYLIHAPCRPDGAPFERPLREYWAQMEALVDAGKELLERYPEALEALRALADREAQDSTVVAHSSGTSITTTATVTFNTAGGKSVHGGALTEAARRAASGALVALEGPAQEQAPASGGEKHIVVSCTPRTQYPACRDAAI